MIWVSWVSKYFNWKSRSGFSARNLSLFKKRNCCDIIATLFSLVWTRLYLSIYLSIYLPIYLSIYLSIWLCWKLTDRERFMMLKFWLEFSKGNFLSSKYSRTLRLITSPWRICYCNLVGTLNHVVTLVIICSFSEISLCGFLFTWYLGFVEHIN